VKASVSGNKASLGSLWPLDLDALVSAWRTPSFPFNGSFKTHLDSWSENGWVTTRKWLVQHFWQLFLASCGDKNAAPTQPDSRLVVSSTKAPATARRQSHGRA